MCSVSLAAFFFSHNEMPMDEVHGGSSHSFGTGLSLLLKYVRCNTNLGATAP